MCRRLAADLVQMQIATRAVRKEEVDALAAKHHADVFETSAKAGQGVGDIFQCIVTHYQNRVRHPPVIPSLPLPPSNPSLLSRRACSRCCCRPPFQPLWSSLFFGACVSRRRRRMATAGAGDCRRAAPSRSRAAADTRRGGRTARRRRGERGPQEERGPKEARPPHRTLHAGGVCLL